MILATKTAIYFLESDGGEAEPDLLLQGPEIRRVAEGDRLVVAALADGGVMILDGDEVKKFQSGIGDRIDSLCIIKESPLDLILGTTPPHLYRLRGEEPADRIKSFDDLEVRSQWFTPWGGPAAVRSLASTREGWIYADIHVGSIMRSPDRGGMWEPVTPTLHVDVHEVATTPASDERVYANTYLSVYVSDDRGDTWEHRSNELDDRYGRGIAVNPVDPDMILCGVSDGPRGVDVHGQLYYTEDAGQSWTHITDGFPESTRMNIDTFHIAYAEEDTAWVVDSKSLLLSTDRGRTWTTHWEAPDEITMISCKTY